MTMKHVPNFITGLRILGTAVLFFIEPFSALFFVLYTLCGLTDILDGYVARKYDATSELGSRLDSIADILYYAVMIIKILPTLLKVLPVYIWYMFWSVVFVRIVSYVLAAIRYKCLAAHHTYMNKASGFFSFLVPYFIKTPVAVQFCTILGVVVMVATLEELFMHILHKDYRADVKTIFSK